MLILYSVLYSKERLETMRQDVANQMSNFELTQRLKREKARWQILIERKQAWGHLTACTAALAREYVHEDKELSEFMGKMSYRAVEMQRKLTIELSSQRFMVEEFEKAQRNMDNEAAWQELRDSERESEGI